MGPSLCGHRCGFNLGKTGAAEPDASIFENEAGGRAMREEAAALIRNPSFGCSDTPPAVEYGAFGPNHTHARRDRTDQRYLELERGLAEALFKRRPERQAHGAVEQRRGEAPMHGTGGIELAVVGNERDNDASALDLGHVVA